MARQIVQGTTEDLFQSAPSIEAGRNKISIQLWASPWCMFQSAPDTEAGRNEGQLMSLLRNRCVVSIRSRH